MSYFRELPIIKYPSFLSDKNSSLEFLEVKNYKSPIPRKEIDKFKRDMSKTGNKLGIFISLYSNIVGKKRFHIENFNDKQKIIYIPSIFRIG